MIIFDSSTLILLAKIDLLDIFISNVQKKIVIPEKVKSEVCIEGRDETPLISELIQYKRINVIKVKNRRQIAKLMEDFNIDPGEAETIITAIKEKTSTIATDDRNTIRACRILHIDFITAIAILIRSLEKGLIEKDEALIKLHKLESVGRYKRKIIEDATKKIQGGA